MKPDGMRELRFDIALWDVLTNRNVPPDHPSRRWAERVIERESGMVFRKGYVLRTPGRIAAVAGQEWGFLVAETLRDILSDAPWWRRKVRRKLTRTRCGRTRRDKLANRMQYILEGQFGQRRAVNVDPDRIPAQPAIRARRRSVKLRRLMDGAGLSRRERCIMEEILSGRRPADIACELSLSRKTVDTYRRRAVAKVKNIL